MLEGLTSDESIELAEVVTLGDVTFPRAILDIAEPYESRIRRMNLGTHHVGLETVRCPSKHRADLPVTTSDVENPFMRKVR
jgi:hypothetical protein